MRRFDKLLPGPTDVRIAEFELPLPATVNTSYGIGTSRRTGKARIVSTKKHKKFKEDAAVLLANQYQLLNKENRAAFDRIIKAVKLNGWFLYLEVLFYLDNLLSRDEDGGLKVVQDVVCKHLGIDDKYVLDAYIGKRKAHGRTRCEIRVFLCEGEAV